MEGSPVRGHERLPIARLSESRDLESFQADLVRIITAELPHTEVFFGLADSTAKALQIPSWVRSHLDRHPALHKKLEQGEMAGIGHADENPVLRPASTVRSSVVLIPLIDENLLQAVVGLASPLDGPQPSAEEIEAVRQLADNASPILSRLQEIDRLRRESQELRKAMQSASKVTDDFAGVVEQKNALEAVLQMRSHLQANVAHELRTPLAAIRGYARMILDGRGGEVNATQKEYLRIVTENTNRLIGLVSWMSYLAELSVQHLKLSTFDLRDVWAKSVESCRPLLSEKSLSLTEVIPDESFVLVADAEKLGYVFNDLITVTSRLSDTGGVVTAEFSHGREREVTVKITGKGQPFPPEKLTGIFDRSFNSIVKPAAQNMDAGATSLSGVYDVVGMHGGRVFVSSTAGQGATFLFTLPAINSGGEENSHEQAINSGRRRR
jgi:signal transduction histidine kinase